MSEQERNRVRYDTALREIEADVIHMGNIVLDMIQLAVKAAVEDDHEFARKVVSMDDEVDRLEHALSEKTILTIFKESPVAHDFLFLTSTLGILGEIEQAGDDAAKLARRAGKLQVDFPDELKSLLQEMELQTRAIFSGALRLVCNYSRDEADRLVLSDDVVDLTYKTSRNKVMELVKSHPEDVRQLFRCTEIFHALEHISDHATDIAKRLRLFYSRV